MLVLLLVLNSERKCCNLLLTLRYIDYDEKELLRPFENTVGESA